MVDMPGDIQPRWPVHPSHVTGRIFLSPSRISTLAGEARQLGIKLLHTADLHLDRPFLGLGPRRSARRAEMRRRFEEILEIARKREVAAVLFAGDLFDGPAAESGPWVKAHLAALAGQGIRVYLIPGNHDPLEQCRFYQGDFPPGVHVFRTPEARSPRGSARAWRSTACPTGAPAAGRARCAAWPAGATRPGRSRWSTASSVPRR